MADLQKFVADLRTYDEGAEPADGWYVAYNDLQKCADIIKRLSARGFQDLTHDNERLTTEGERKDELIRQAIKAIESLDDDVLGYGQAADGHGDVYHWPLREELLTNLRGATASDKQTERADVVDDGCDGTYGFDAHITVMADGDSKQEAADRILEHCLDADIAISLMKEGTLNSKKSTVADGRT